MKLAITFLTTLITFALPVAVFADTSSTQIEYTSSPSHNSPNLLRTPQSEGDLDEDWEIAHSRRANQNNRHHKNPKNYSSVVIFGASYCDNGRPRDPIYNSSLRLPPYVGGRWSNGPIFMEYLANGVLGYKAKLFDYAYGGAQANNDLTAGSVPDTRNQSRQYMAEVAAGKAVRGKGRVLHVWWIGINPMGQIWGDAINEGATKGNTTAAKRARTRVQQQIDEVLSQVKAVRNNPKVQALDSNYLVLPIPPLEIVPALRLQSQTLAGDNTTEASSYLNYIGELTRQYNTGLTNGARSLGPRHGKKGWVRSFDVPTFWYDMKAHPSKYRFTNVTTACLNTTTSVTCATPDTYQYWDMLHPTTRTHKYLAKKLARVATAY